APMCNITELLSLILFAAFTAAASRAGFRQQRFAQALRSSEAAVWADISKWHRWHENSELHESAVTFYILQGLFVSLPQQTLVQQGAQCRRWHFASIVALALLGTHASITEVFVPLSCF
ncbi:hypothetical protein, partial [Azohydromonas lata]|uniref:hypothetical protein n=1 Tax=Azohydromonas lata TaxID=45677 RepID=UPI001C3F324C